MQEYANAEFEFDNNETAEKILSVVQVFLDEYEYEEPEKCNWVDYLSVEDNRVIIDSDAMCGWDDYIELFESLSKKITEEFPDVFFIAESEYTNISAGYTYYYSATYDKDGLKILDTTICCEYCGHPIFCEDAFFMRNEDEGVIALCSEDCKTGFLNEWNEENGEWEETTREDYEEENVT